MNIIIINNNKSLLPVAPEPVENCSVINKSSDTFHLQCVPGFDGGMNQSFHILVRDKTTNIIKYDNASLSKPELMIGNHHKYLSIPGAGGGPPSLIISTMIIFVQT